MSFIMNKIGKIILSPPPKNKLSDLLSSCTIPHKNVDSLTLKSGLDVADKSYNKKNIPNAKCFVCISHANVPAQNALLFFLSTGFSTCVKNYIIHDLYSLNVAIIVFSARSLTIDQWLIHQQHYKRVL